MVVGGRVVEEVELEVEELVEELVELDGLGTDEDEDEEDDEEVELSGGAVVELVEVPWKNSSPGRSNGHDARPLVARLMYLCQIVEGSEPPVTEMPWTDFMKDPSGYPTHTAVVSLQVNPTNHASR